MTPRFQIQLRALDIVPDHIQAFDHLLMAVPGLVEPFVQLAQLRFIRKFHRFNILF